MGYGMKKPNAHRVFAEATTAPDYLEKLTLPEKRVAPLREAREIVRGVLRKAVPGWQKVLAESVMFDSAAGYAERQVLTPKFRLQGSMAYHTLNAPAHEPPQQIDSDDGMFLPVSFISVGGTAKPAIASASLFNLVELSLTETCQENGWRLEQKDTCVRIRLDSFSHMDLAMYAIPDSEFAVLVEKALNFASFDSAAFDNAAEFEEPVYRKIPEDKIMLAHRQRHWMPSDPRKLQDWFEDAIKTHGPQLRRVCRYLKGWRDHVWHEKGPSSIALMKCVVTVYDEIGKSLQNKRDDLAVAAVAERLPALFSSPIANPVVDGEYLDAGWGEARKEYVSNARSLSANLETALRPGTSAEGVLSYLKSAFGSRIPSDASLVHLEGEESKTLATSASVLVEAGRSRGPTEAVEKRGETRYA